jgi:glycosyltransferase involved in cell wall biosynthesis
MGLVHSFEALLRAAAILAERQPDVLFLLIGNGPKRNEIERSAMERGLPNLRVMDYLPFDQVPQSLSAAHLAFVCIGPGMEGVIAPSKMYASLKVGTPIALAEERPSDLTRVLEDGVEGIRLRPGDGEGLARYITALKADPARTDAARRTNAAWYERNCALNVNAVAFRDCLRGLLDASN